MYFSKFLLLDIVQFGVVNGANKDELCSAIGIPFPEHIAQGDQVSYDVIADAMTMTARAIGDEHLGLHLGEAFKLKGIAQVYHIMEHSETLEEAFANAVRYSKMISDAMESSMVKMKDRIMVSFEVNPDWAIYEEQVVRQITDVTLVCALNSIYWLTNRRCFPTEVHMNYPLPKQKNEYYRVFDCPVKFGQPRPCIIFPDHLFGKPLSSKNEGLLSFLKQSADEEVGKIQPESPLIMQIKKNLLRALPERPTLKETADVLHLSSRTLQRRLSELDTGYKEIENGIRLKLAKRLLLHEQRSIDEVSYLLGFSESSVFIHFFKKKTGITPKRYRTSVFELSEP